MANRLSVGGLLLRSVVALTRLGIQALAVLRTGGAQSSAPFGFSHGVFSSHFCVGRPFLFVFLAHAGFACSASFVPTAQVEVGATQLMTARAVRFPRVYRGNANSAQDVCAVGNRLKVVRGSRSSGCDKRWSSFIPSGICPTNTS